MSKNPLDKDLVEIPCVACGEKLRVGRKFIGRHGRCPHCKTKFLLQKPASQPKQEPEKADLAGPMVDLGEDVHGAEAEEYDETPSFAVVLPFWEEWLQRLRVAVPCWTISLGVHLALLVLLAVITVTIPEKDESDIQVNVQLKVEEDKKDVYLTKEDIQKDLDRMLPVRTATFTAPDASQTAGIAAGPGEAGVVPVIGITGSARRGYGNPFAVATGPVSFFGSNSGSGVASVIFVVDRSASMDGDRIKTAKVELVQSIERLTVANMFNVIFFGSYAANYKGHKAPGYRAKLCWPTMVLATTERKEECVLFLEKIKAEGLGTDVSQALELAIRARPDLIYVLTDGEFDEGRGIISQAKRMMSKYAKGKRVRINTIGFRSKGAEFVLRKLAADSGGQYRYVR